MHDAPERIATWCWNGKTNAGQWSDNLTDHYIPVVEYVRADLVEAMKAENQQLRGAKEAAVATLTAWFDRRKLAHEAIDQAIIDAVGGYLRTSRVGGMPQPQSDLVLGVISDMARLSLFADLFARAALRSTEGG